ncbi:hypothetical protein CLOM_g20685 [Closterium sp. NIES-68]|nr:hypothetical protein CLOM_g20685 [Closterium sp. NIES-68]
MAELEELGNSIHLPLYPITSLQVGRKTSKGSILSVHIAREAGQLIFFVNSPWCPKRSSGKDAGLWQLLSKAPRYDSPFANNSLMDRLLGEIMALEESFCRTPRLGSGSGGGAGGGSGRHRKVKWKSLDTFVRRLHARRRALSHLHPPPHGLCGCVTLEVCWSDVRGLRYENELQAEANLAMEVTRVVKREFDSFDLAVQAHALRLNASPPVHGTQLSQTSLPAASPGVSAGPWVGRSFSGKRLELGSPLASAAAAGGGGGAAAVAGGGGGRVCSAGSSFSAGEPGSRLAAAAAAGRSAGASFASAGSGAAMYAGFGYGAAAAGGCDLWGGQRQACIGSPRRVLFLEPQSPCSPVPLRLHPAAGAAGSAASAAAAAATREELVAFPSSRSRLSDSQLCSPHHHQHQHHHQQHQHHHQQHQYHHQQHQHHHQQHQHHRHDHHHRQEAGTSQSSSEQHTWMSDSSERFSEGCSEMGLLDADFDAHTPPEAECSGDRSARGRSENSDRVGANLDSKEGSVARQCCANRESNAREASADRLLDGHDPGSQSESGSGSAAEERESYFSGEPNSGSCWENGTQLYSGSQSSVHDGVEADGEGSSVNEGREAEAYGSLDSWKEVDSDFCENAQKSLTEAYGSLESWKEVVDSESPGDGEPSVHDDREADGVVSSMYEEADGVVSSVYGDMEAETGDGSESWEEVEAGSLACVSGELEAESSCAGSVCCSKAERILDSSKKLPACIISGELEAESICAHNVRSEVERDAAPSILIPCRIFVSNSCCWSEDGDACGAGGAGDGDGAGAGGDIGSDGGGSCSDDVEENERRVGSVDGSCGSCSSGGGSGSSSTVGDADADADADADGDGETEVGSISYCSTSSSSAEHEPASSSSAEQQPEHFPSPLTLPTHSHSSTLFSSPQSLPTHPQPSILLTSPKTLLPAPRAPPTTVTYPDTLLLFRFTHPHLPAALADVITTDQRLLHQLESGLPAWAVFLQSCAGLSALYRPWMRPLVAYACFIVSLVTVLIGFYDLYKNIPILQEMLARLLGPIWGVVGTWDMGTRLRYLGTILFLQNWERAFKWVSAAWRIVSHVLSVLSYTLSLLLRPFQHHWALLTHTFLSSFTKLFSSVWGLLSTLGKLVTSSGGLFGYAFRPLWLLLQHTVVPVCHCVYGGWRVVYGGCAVVYQLVSQACSSSVFWLVQLLSSQVSFLYTNCMLLYQLVAHACSSSVWKLAQLLSSHLSFIYSQAVVLGRLLGVLIQPILFLARAIWSIGRAIVLPLLHFIHLVLSPLISALLALLKLPLQLLRLLLQLASFLYSTFSHSLSHSLSLSLASSLKALSLHLAYFVKTLMQPLTYSIKALSQSLTYSYISVANSISYASKAVSSSLRLVGGALKLGSATKAVGQRISAAGSAVGQVSAAAGSAVVRSPSSSLLQMWKNLFQKLFRAIMWIFKGVGSFVAAANRHRLSTRHYVLSQVRRLQMRLIQATQAAQAAVLRHLTQTLSAQRLVRPREIWATSQATGDEPVEGTQLRGSGKGCGDGHRGDDGDGEEEYWDAREIDSEEECEDEECEQEECEEEKCEEEECEEEECEEEECEQEDVGEGLGTDYGDYEEGGEEEEADGDEAADGEEEGEEADGEGDEAFADAQEDAFEGSSCGETVD